MTPAPTPTKRIVTPTKRTYPDGSMDTNAALELLRGASIIPSKVAIVAETPPTPSSSSFADRVQAEIEAIPVNKRRRVGGKKENVVVPAKAG